MQRVRRIIRLAVLLACAIPLLPAYSEDQTPPVLATVSYEAARIEGPAEVRCDAWSFALHRSEAEALRVQAATARLWEMTYTRSFFVDRDGEVLYAEEGISEVEHWLSHPVVDLMRAETSVWELRGRWYGTTRADWYAPDAVSTTTEPDLPFQVAVEGERLAWNATGPFQGGLPEEHFRNGQLHTIEPWTEARSLTGHGAFHGSGQAYLAVSGPAAVADATGQQFYLDGRAANRTDIPPLYSHRIDRTWFFELHNFDIELNGTAGEVVCGHIAATGSGRLNLASAGGEAVRDQVGVRFENASAALNGPFELDDEGRPPHLGPPASTKSTARIQGEGAFFVDGRPTLAPLVAAASNAGELTLAAALVLAVVAITKYGLNVVTFCYSRIRPGQVLDHPRRQSIVEFVRSNPGVEVGTVARTLKLPWPTVHYHARLLARGGQLKLRRVGGRTALFLPRPEFQGVETHAYLLRRPTLRRTYDLLREKPGIDQSTAANDLGLSVSQVCRAFATLEAHGLVHSISQGRRRGYRALNSEP